MPPLPPRIFSPKTTNDLATLLGVSAKYLKVVLRSEKHYDVFYLTKKSGGIREIAAPSNPIRSLQEKFLHYLEHLYRGRAPAYGFIKGKSIKLNADKHAKSQFVLNVDLKDFFPLIHFGRVRGMLMGKPYFFGSNASRDAADLCCRRSALPQGAPTSPILSNMVCAKLDSELKALARKYNCVYTRYADDITFSTKARRFPAPLARVPTETDNELRVGEELLATIHGNGFAINEKKIRLTSRHQRHEVTGLTVNNFPNVQRRFVRQVRAMLHAWRKFGYDSAEKEFHLRYDKRQR